MDEQLSPEDIAQIRSIVEGRLQENENMQDVLTGARHLASRRALLRGMRSPSRDDLEFAFAILTWWPGKPHPADHVERELLSIRPPVFEGAADSQFERIDALVPDTTLLMTRRELWAAQQQDVRTFLNIEDTLLPPPGGSEEREDPSGFGIALDRREREVSR
jgi:hypothetical protein